MYDRRMEKDDGSFRLVAVWSLGGLAVSAVLGSLLLSRWVPPPENAVIERAIHNMDRQTCERVLHSFTQPQPTGTRILWLWAEESTPGVFTGASWTSRVTGSGTEMSSRSPRPYAFDPASQAAPEGACSFPNNSLHIVSVEHTPREGEAAGTGRP